MRKSEGVLMLSNMRDVIYIHNTEFSVELTRAEFKVETLTLSLIDLRGDRIKLPPLLRDADLVEALKVLPRLIVTSRTKKDDVQDGFDIPLICL